MTCLCIIYLLKPHFYVAKVGYAEAVLTIYVLSKNKKKYQIFFDEIFKFLQLKKKSLYIEWASFPNVVGKLFMVILNAASLVELTLTADFSIFPVGYWFGTSDGM